MMVLMTHTTVMMYGRRPEGRPAAALTPFYKNQTCPDVPCMGP